MIILIDIEINQPTILRTKKQLSERLDVGYNTILIWSKVANYKLHSNYIIYFDVDVEKLVRTNKNIVHVSPGQKIDISEYQKMKNKGQYKHIKTGKIVSIKYVNGAFIIA